MRRQQGYFITVEGGEGAGKTELIMRMTEALEEAGHKVLRTREPGGIPIAEAIRSVILDKGNTSMDARTEALLYAAARRQHLVEKVHPALDAGALVICDRFIDSSLAYQGHARGLGIDEVLSINQFATDGLMPDLTLYLDLDPEVGLRRINANAGREVNRLDLESISFHQKVRQGYQLIARRFPNRFAVLDANRTPEEITRAALRLLQDHMRQKKPNRKQLDRSR